VRSIGGELRLTPTHLLDRSGRSEADHQRSSKGDDEQQGTEETFGDQQIAVDSTNLAHALAGHEPPESRGNSVETERAATGRQVDGIRDPSMSGEDGSIGRQRGDTARGGDQPHKGGRIIEITFVVDTGWQWRGSRSATPGVCLGRIDQSFRQSGVNALSETMGHDLIENHSEADGRNRHDGSGHGRNPDCVELAGSGSAHATIIR
jgi:hypothetical protein